MRRACTLAIAVSICACSHVGPLFGPEDAGADAAPDAGSAAGDLLWSAAIEAGWPSDVVALPDGGALAVGAMGDGAVFHGAGGGAIAAETAGVFLARYDEGGGIVSVDAPIRGRDLTAHAARALDGALLLAGSYADEAVFAPGTPGAAVFVPLGSDAYAARYAADGTLAWAATVYGTGYESMIDVAARADGGAIAVGTFGLDLDDEHAPGAAALYDGAGGETALASAGGSDALVAAFGPGGALAWRALAGGEGQDRAYAVAVRTYGGAFAGGEFGGGVDDEGCGAAGHPALFGGGGGDDLLLEPAGAADGFVASYGADGQLLWARGVGGPCADWVRDVVARADGSVVALGVIGGPAVFGAGEENETVVDCGALASCDDMQRAFIAAFAADGDLEWVRTSGFCTGDLVSDLGPELRAGELALSRDGGIAAAGAYQGACAFGAGGPEEIALAATDGTYDPFAAAFSADGAPRWAAAGAGTCDDGAEAAAFLVDGSLIVAGIYGADWQFVDSGFPCSSSIAFGAGEPNETVLPDPEDGNGASGFVAVFADH